MLTFTLYYGIIHNKKYKMKGVINMALVPAKCTQCGGNIEVDNTHEAGICKFCGTPFVTEKAIYNYNTTIVNNNNFAGANITISNGDIENYRTLARRATSSSNGIDALQYYKKIVELNAKDWEAAYYVEIYSALINDITCINEISVREYATNWSKSANNSDTNKEICNSLSAYAKNLYSKGIESLFVNANVFYNAIVKSTHLYETAYIIAKGDIENSILYLETILDNLQLGKSMLNCNNNSQIGRLISEISALEDKFLNEMKSINPSYQPKNVENNDSDTQSKSGGCYIATCVYGSYDCPQVWTLRRYRDYTLDETWHGRLFIKCYYAVSPKLVKWFGNYGWFRKPWKIFLDGMVERLNSKGVEDTKYNDKY